MGNGYFFTGFPGFICNQLIREILKRNPLQAVNDLKNSGISCPDFKDSIKVMTSFYLNQKDNPNYQINIQ